MYTLLISLIWGCVPTPVDTDIGTETDSPTDTDDIVDPNGDPAAVELLGRCEPGLRFGGLRIDNGRSFGFVDGTILDGVVPNTVPTPVQEGSGCSLDRRENPFCNPACDPGFTCDLSETCVPFPASQDLGTVEVSGTLPVSLALDPLQPTLVYSNTTVSNPPVNPGELIEVRVSEGMFGPFDLHGVGVEALMASSEILVVRGDEDLQVTWTPPDDAEARSSTFFELNIDQHGLTPILLTCEWEDALGTGTVPASMLHELINAGVTGFPSARLMRFTADHHVVPDGCIDLVVTSPSREDLPIDVDGFTPCFEDSQCIPPQTCDTANEICVDP